MFRRIRDAWRVLTEGVFYTPPGPRTIYVNDRPNHLVQLVYYHDYLIGLDGQGGLWKIDLDNTYDGYPFFEFVSEGPRRTF